MTGTANSDKLGNYFVSRRERGDDSLPLLSVTMRDGLVPRDTIDHRFDSELEASEHLAVRKGDIAYNMMRMWQGASGLANHDAVVSPAYVVLQPLPGMDPVFASYWFKSARMIYLFWAYSYGLTDDRLRLYAKDFSTIPVSPPPLDDQRRKARVLQACDHTIQAAEALIEAKRLSKRALMRRLVVSKNLTPLGAIAELNAQSLSESTNPDFRFEYFPIGEEESDVENADSGWLRFGEAPSRARRLATAGDIAYSTVRPMLRRVFKAPLHPSAVYSTGYAIISGRSNVSSDFLFHVMTTDCVERQVFARLTGTGYPAISASDLAQVLIPMPPFDAQQGIARVLDTVDIEIDLLITQADLLRSQKRGLMQKLLSEDLPLPARLSTAAE